ncbi:tetratricopeptide repeat protein [Candidatus Nitrotoga sp. 1052]|uniref:tetratricopeptide repeat protein n=1 Tax=Candidatus Nitrotoga sp. 1052 TaxID=2886964 RepID=UPI001EF45D60|nr:tetratricopeptide repeat protein [Candidatus Nitrotoga sp. 1052]CAH1075310.1 Sel1 repeat-containing protein [Candidatus Nitrotoga sp. 1052]
MSESIDFKEGLNFFLSKDYVSAEKCFRKAAEEGDPEAQFCLGDMYNNGYGVVKDERKAVALFRKSAEQRFAPSQINLGIMYSQGRGVEQDLIEAFMWLSIAGRAVDEEGEDLALDEDGRDLLGTVEEQMTAGQITEALRRSSAWMKSNQII